MILTNYKEFKYYLKAYIQSFLAMFPCAILSVIFPEYYILILILGIICFQQRWSYYFNKDLSPKHFNPKQGE